MRRGFLVLALVAWGGSVAGTRAQQGPGSPAPEATAAPSTPTSQGIALFEERRYAEAKLLLGKAVAWNPGDAEAQAYLGRVLFDFDADLNGAASHLGEAVRLAPNVSRYHQWLGSVYSAQAGQASVFKAPGLAKSGLEELEKAVALDPSDIEARMALLRFYLGAPSIVGGSVEKATEQALAVTAIDRYQGLLAQALVAQREKQTARAEQLYRTAIAVSPQQGEAYNSLGYLLLGAKRRDEAVEAFRTYVEVSPGEANPHDSLAEGLLAAGQVDASISEYRKALAIEPTFASSFLGLARCYEKKEAWPDAIGALKAFLEIVPNGPRADEVRDRIEELSKKAR